MSKIQTPGKSRSVGVGDGGLSCFHGKLRKEAADAALIRDIATDSIKRPVYNRLHDGQQARR